MMERISFGDGAEMADALLTLVLVGRKTATCAPLREYEKEGAALPRTGERKIVLNGKGQPACVIEYTAVDCAAFSAIDASFAAAEGEGDGSLADWRTIHQEFFQNHGGFSPDMMLVCRKFCVVERLPGSAT